MLWHLFGLVFVWRVIKWVLGLFMYILILIVILVFHLFLYTARQEPVAHRPRDTLMDIVVGWCVIGLCGIGMLITPIAQLQVILLLVFIVLFLALVTHRFHPSDWVAQPPIELATLQQIQIYTIRITPNLSWSLQKAIHLTRQLTAICPYISLSVEADAVGIYFRLIDLIGYRQDTITNLLYSVYPDLEIDIKGLSVTNWQSHPNVRRNTLFVKHTQPFALPLQDVPSTADLDQLMVLSQIANELKLGEHLSMTLALGNAAPVAQREGLRQVTQNAASFWMLFTRQGCIEHFTRILNREIRVPRRDDFNMGYIKNKLQSRMYHAALWIQVQSIDNQRLSYLTDLMRGYISSLSDLPYNQLIIHSQLQGILSNTTPDVYTFYKNWCTGVGAVIPPTLVLNHTEIASLWHLPHANVVASRVQRLPKWAPISEQMARQHSGLHLGLAHYHHQWRDAYLEHEMRKRHVNIIGQTGIGKSTLLFHQIAQDIQNGYGVALIDPHGTLANYVLMSGILTGREHDVVVVDLNDFHYPPPLNPFVLRQTMHGVLRVIHIIENLFQGTEQAVQTSTFLRAALMLLSQQPDVTMKDIAYLFLDETYRANLLTTTTDTDIHLYLNKQYHNGRKSYQANIANPILNRIRPFYANPYLYPIVCHPNSLNFTELVRQNKIILISLNTNSDLVPPQERHLLGTLIMSELQYSGMRSTRPDPYYIYVDEVQHFVTTSLDVIFAEARKNGLAMTTANQYLGQLKGQTREAMLGNAGTNIIFRVGPDDVSTLAARTKPEFTEHDLLNMDAYTAAVKTQFQTQTQPTFTLRTQPLPPLPANAKHIANHIRQLSRKQYMPKSRVEVLDWLEQRYQPPSNQVNLF